MCARAPGAVTLDTILFSQTFCLAGWSAASLSTLCTPYPYLQNSKCFKSLLRAVCLRLVHQGSRCGHLTAHTIPERDVRAEVTNVGRMVEVMTLCSVPEQVVTTARGDARSRLDQPQGSRVRERPGSTR